VKRAAFFLLALLAALLPLAPPLHAEQGLVAVDVPFQLLATLDGRPILLSGQASVSGLLCMPPLSYASPLERYLFEGWYVAGQKVSGSRCLMVDGGSYLAHYQQQFLVGLASDPPGLVAMSIWANASSPTAIAVPTEIEGDGFRATLKAALLNGFPLPILNGSVIVGVRAPALIQLSYEELVRLTIVYPNFTRELWVPAGKDVSLRLEEHIALSGDARLELRGVELGTGLVQVANGRLSVRPEGPMTLEPLYVKQYRVRIDSPQGPLAEGWYDEGARLSLSAPQIIELGPGRRLAFTGWRGINASGPSLSLSVTEPIEAQALYELQVEVTLISPLGTSSYWLAAGETRALYVPPSLPASLGFTRVLTSLTANGKAISAQNGIAMVTPLEPMTLVASYSLAPDLPGIMIILGIAAALTGAYLALSRMGRRPRPPGQ
jgi:hypothetical protein